MLWNRKPGSIGHDRRTTLPKLESMLCRLIGRRQAATTLIPCMHRPAPARGQSRQAVPSRGSADGAPPPGTLGLAGLVRELGHPVGAGVVGPRATEFLRAVVVELLVTGSEQVRLVIGRSELDQLFGDHLKARDWDALFPRLRVFDLLEDAIEHLEADLLMPGGRPSGSDLPPGAAGESPSLYWIATPGADADVVFQMLRGARDHDLTALMLGPWPYGSTYAFGDDGALINLLAAEEVRRAVTVTAAEASAAVRTHALAMGGRGPDTAKGPDGEVRQDAPVPRLPEQLTSCPYQNGRFR